MNLSPRALLLSVLFAASAAALVVRAQARPQVDDSVEQREQLTTALSRAAKENRRVLIQWGNSDVHSESRALNTAMAQPKVKRKLLYEYDLVSIDFGPHERGTSLARELGIELAKHTPPLLTVLDAGRNVLATTAIDVWWSKDTATVDGDGLLAFLTEHQAPYLEAAKQREAALARAKAEGKRVFLHFGAPW